MRKRINLLTVALCLPALGLLTLLPMESVSSISCPKCVTFYSGGLNLVPYCRVGCGKPGSAVYYYDCLACCHPVSGSSAGMITETNGQYCGLTRVYSSWWNGTTQYCSWKCAGGQVTDQPNGNGCAFDMINSPNCTYGSFLGYQYGTRCDSNTYPQCS